MVYYKLCAFVMAEIVIFSRYKYIHKTISLTFYVHHYVQNLFSTVA